jgi:hypothetical protein
MTSQILLEVFSFKLHQKLASSYELAKKKSCLAWPRIHISQNTEEIYNQTLVGSENISNFELSTDKKVRKYPPHLSGQSRITLLNKYANSIKWLKFTMRITQ